MKENIFECVPVLEGLTEEVPVEVKESGVESPKGEVLELPEELVRDELSRTELTLRIGRGLKGDKRTHCGVAPVRDGSWASGDKTNIETILNLVV
jgi:hypothetical protein